MTADLLSLYEQLAVIRRTEKAAHDLFMAGLVKGTTHLAAGHEAIAVGAGASGALNMAWDADIDAKMRRTRGRPVPAGRVSRGDAAFFGGALALFSVMPMGLAVSLELPLLVIDIQRGGPSTGLPTKTEASDLLMAMYGRHVGEIGSRIGPLLLVVRAAAASDSGAAGVWQTLQDERLHGMTMFA